MKYYLVNPALDAQIKDIRLKIRLSMNGVVSDKMTQSGIIYKKNFGVSIPRIKEIAAIYQPDHDLAQRLWNLKIRETMILATLLEPVQKFTYELAAEWIKEFNQVEIVEQATMNLFSKLGFANELAVEWTGSETDWIKVTGFMLAARISNKLTQNEVELILKNAIQSFDTINFHLYKSVASSLSRLCRRDKEMAMHISNLINTISVDTSVAAQFISNEVRQELLFLDIL